MIATARHGSPDKSQGAFFIIPLLDLTRQDRSLKPQLEKAIARVLLKGNFILGPEVARFEKEFARVCQTRFGVGVASGTDALELGLRSVGVGKGDWVATVSFTFLATVDSILHVGAQPLFVDVDPTTLTMDPQALRETLSRLPLRTRRRGKAILPVHLFGHPCNMDEILQIARQTRMSVIEDCAQAAGAKWKGRPVGSLGDVGCFSFFPSKNLGAFGDGGMVVTNSPKLFSRVRQLRVHGRDERGNQVALGRNSRLDELQAAILRVKLKFLTRWIAKRQALARAYQAHLSRIEGIECPLEKPGATHAFCLYVIRTPHRDAVRQRLQRRGITAQVYYPLPVHRQPLHRKEYRNLHLPRTEEACRQVLALPLFPELRLEELKRICQALAESVG